MWKAYDNVLPTKAYMFKRKIVADPLCPICRLEAETTGHALWSCPATRDASNMCKRKLQKSRVENEDFIHIVETLHNKLDNDGLELLAVVAKNLWFRRNVPSGNFCHLNQIVRKATESFL